VARLLTVFIYMERQTNVSGNMRYSCQKRLATEDLGIPVKMLFIALKSVHKKFKCQARLVQSCENLRHLLSAVQQSSTCALFHTYIGLISPNETRVQLISLLSNGKDITRA